VFFYLAAALLNRLKERGAFPTQVLVKLRSLAYLAFAIIFLPKKGTTGLLLILMRFKEAIVLRNRLKKFLFCQSQVEVTMAPLQLDY
jgi:hypothetical protein